MNIIKVNDISAKGVRVYTHLTERQMRNKLEPEQGIFIAESPKVIGVALDAGYEPLSFLMEEKHIVGDAHELIARCGDVPVYTGPSAMLQTITGYELTRGVLCAMRRPRQASLEAVCAHKHHIVVLDGVVNATNTGAIFRAAAALGMDAVVLTRACCDPLNRRSVRVSMGTVFQIPWTYLGERVSDWMHGGIDVLHRLGFKVVAMALRQDAITIDAPQLMAEERLAIVMGSEGDGLPQAVIEQCDYTACIPMQHGVDSLNVAAAAAIAFWQLGRSGLVY